MRKMVVERLRVNGPLVLRFEKLQRYGATDFEIHLWSQGLKRAAIFYSEQYYRGHGKNGRY